MTPAPLAPTSKRQAAPATGRTAYAPASRARATLRGGGGASAWPAAKVAASRSAWTGKCPWSRGKTALSAGCPTKTTRQGYSPKSHIVATLFIRRPSSTARLSQPDPSQLPARYNVATSKRILSPLARSSRGSTASSCSGSNSSRSGSCLSRSRGCFRSTSKQLGPPRRSAFVSSGSMSLTTRSWR